MISGSFKTARTIMNADAQLFRHYFAAPGALLRRAPGVDLNQLSGAPFCLAGEKIKEERPCRAVDIFAEDSIFPVKHPFGLQLFDKHISMLIYNLSTEFMQKISTLIRHLPRKTNKFSPGFSGAPFGIMALQCLKPVFASLQVLRVVNFVSARHRGKRLHTRIDPCFLDRVGKNVLRQAITRERDMKPPALFFDDNGFDCPPDIPVKPYYDRADVLNVKLAVFQPDAGKVIES